VCVLQKLSATYIHELIWIAELSRIRFGQKIDLAIENSRKMCAKSFGGNEKYSENLWLCLRK
jgi:hypothetical protein